MNLEANVQLSEKFNRRLKEWGTDIPNIPIDKFLLQNKELFGLKEVNDYWKCKKLRNFCFDVVQARNNGNNKGNKEIDTKRKNELYQVLEKYTTQKINEFKKEEERGKSRGELKIKRDEILGFVRAKEALKDKAVKNYDAEANNQKIRDAKVVTKLRGKAG